MGVQTVRFKGEFDVSQIMNSIKQMRAELAKQGNSPLFGNLDKEISKLEGLGSTIQAQIGKGFASTKEFKAFEANISKLELEFQRLGQSFDAINGDNLKSALRSLDKQVDSMRKKANEMAAAFKTSFSTETSGMGEKAKALTKDIAEMARLGKSYEEAQKRINQQYEEELKKKRESISLTKQEIAALEGKTFNVQKSSYQKRQFTSNGNDIDSTQLAKVNTAYEKSIRGASTEAQAAKAFKKELESLNITMKNESLVLGKLKANYTAYRTEVDANKSAISHLNKDLNTLVKEERTLNNQQSQMSNALRRQKEEYEQAANAGRQYATAEAQVEKQAEKYRNTSNQLNSSINKTKAEMSGMAANLRQGAAATADAVKSQTSLNNSLDSMKSRIAYVFSLGNAYYQLRRVLQNTLEDVKNIDKAFASIAMVTDKTVSGLWEHYGEYASMAQRLGQSTESAIKASALFYQQGLKDAEVMQLTEDTMKLATLANLDFEQATSQMTAALRGFHMEMDQGAHVTDVYSELAAHAAADVNGIAYAMSKTASIANNAGMSFENTAAFLTQMIETTQEAPENIGTAMKTIIARFTELKKNIAGTAESEFDDLEYNKVDKALKSVGVSLKDTTGQFRNLDEVFMELSAKWNTLDRNSQRYIATIAAGSRQQSRFIAMMEDYNRTMELVNITKDAQGRSDEQFAKNAESLQFKIQELKTAWEQFRMSLADNQTIKDVVSSLTKFVDMLNGLADSPSKLIGLGAAFVVIGKGIATGIVNGIKGIGGIMPSVGSAIGTKLHKAIYNKTKQKYELRVEARLDNIRKLEAELENAAKKLDMTKQLQQAEAEIDKINQKMSQGEGFYHGAPIKESLQAAEAEAEKLKNELNGLTTTQAQAEVDRLTAKLETAKNKNVSNGMLGLLGNEKAVQKIGAASGQALGMAFSTAAMQIITNQDPFSVLKQSVLIFCATAIPQFLTTTLAAIGTAEAAAVAAEATVSLGITLIIQAVVTGITMLIQFVRNSESAEEKAKKAAEANAKAVEKAAEVADNTKKMAKEAKTAAEEGEKLKKEYQELSQKTEKTNEEQQRYNELIEEIQEKYGEIVLYYNETTNQLSLQIDKWDQILEKQRESANLQRELSGYTERQNIAAQTYNQIMNSILGFENKYGLNKTANERAEMAGAAMIYGSETYEGKFLREWLSGVKPGDAIDANKYFNLMAEEWKQAVKEMFEYFKDSYIREYAEMHPDADESEAIIYGTWASAILQRDNAEIANFMRVVSEQEPGASGTITLGGENEKLSSYENSAAAHLVTYHGKDYKWTEKEIAEIVYAAFNGDKNAAEKFWEELATEEARAAFLFQKRNEDIAKETLNGIWNKIGSSKNTLNLLYQRATEGTDKDIENLRVFLEKHDIELSNINSIVDNIEQKRREVYEKLNLKYGIDSLKLPTSTKDLNTFADLIDSRAGGGASVNALSGFYSSMFYKFTNMKTLTGTQVISDEDALKLIGSVNWSEVTLGNLNANKKQFIKTLNEITGEAFSPEMADTIWEGFFDEAKEYETLDIKINSVGDLQKLKEDLTSYLDDTLESAKNVQSVVKNQLVDGYIGYTDKRKLEKELEKAQLTADDYLTENGNGYTLDVEALQKAYDEKIQDEDTLLEFARAQIDAGIQELENERTLLQALSAQEDIDASLLDKELTRLDISERMAYNALVMAGKAEEAEKMLKGTEGIIINVDKADSQAAIDAINDTINKLLEIRDDDEKLKAYTGYNDTVAAGAEVNKYFADTAEDAREELEKNQKTVDDLTKKIKALNEAMYGEDNRKNKLDYLYNYTTALNRLAEEATDAKNALNDLTEEDNASEIIGRYTSALSNASSVRQAENEVLSKSIDNFEYTLSNELSKKLSEINAMDDKHQISTNARDYFMRDESTGAWLVNFEALNAARIPDDFSDYVENSIDQMNKWQDQIKKNVDEDKKVQKEVEKMQKDSLKNIISLEDDVIKVLKDKYQEEINLNREKNKAMEDANKEYLESLEDAIKKERDLRDRQNAWEDLSQKEKQLSLMSRDTSGANAKDVAQLEQEVQEDRQKLLDQTVDDMLNTMKEHYEQQQEANEQEIAALENLVDDAAITREAISIISSWSSSDDMIAWMFANNKDIETMSENKLEQEMQQWKDEFTQAQLSRTLLDTDLNSAIQASDERISLALKTYQETATTAATTSLASTSEKVKTAIADAQKAITDAIEELRKEQEKRNNSKSGNSNGSNSSGKSGKMTQEQAERAQYWTDKMRSAPSGMEKDAISAAARKEGYITKNGNFVYDKEGAERVSKTLLPSPITSAVTNAANATTQQAEAEKAAEAAKGKWADTSWDKNKNQDYLSSPYGSEETQDMLIELYNSGKLYNVTANSPSANANYGPSQWRARVRGGHGEAFYVKDTNTAAKIRNQLVDVEGWGNAWIDYLFASKNDWGKSKDWATIQEYYQGEYADEEIYEYYNKYKKGGLVDYTGPAQVDGTPSRPEAFLSAEDTQRFMTAAELFAMSPLLNSSSAQNAVSSSVGDTSIEININVESISDDYDVDRLIKRVEDDINETARPVGTQVILNKRV